MFHREKPANRPHPTRPSSTPRLRPGDDPEVVLRYSWMESMQK
jgi:hypothetical protein